MKETFDAKIIDFAGKEDTISISASAWLRCPLENASADKNISKRSFR
jgi:hypothetical protein